MIGFLKRLFKRWRCKHEHLTTLHNIHGDEINLSDGWRSWRQCDDCGILILDDYDEDPEVHQRTADYYNVRRNRIS